MMNRLKYFLTRYLVKVGFLAIALFLLVMTFLRVGRVYGIAPFFDTFWSFLLLMLAIVVFIASIIKFPLRTKREVCRQKGHKISGCKCARCGAVIDSTRHVWDGCICSHCGERKDADDPLHKWNDCVCTHCGATREGSHNWVEAGSKYYGGNDVNGWGPGGETVTVYVCSRCGRRMKETQYDDEQTE